MKVFLKYNLLNTCLRDNDSREGKGWDNRRVEGGRMGKEEGDEREEEEEEEEKKKKVGWWLFFHYFSTSGNEDKKQRAEGRCPH